MRFAKDWEWSRSICRSSSIFQKLVHFPETLWLQGNDWLLLLTSTKPPVSWTPFKYKAKATWRRSKRIVCSSTDLSLYEAQLASSGLGQETLPAPPQAMMSYSWRKGRTPACAHNSVLFSYQTGREGRKLTPKVSSPNMTVFSHTSGRSKESVCILCVLRNRWECWENPIPEAQVY